jgi:RHS repeat-associated protein
MKRITFSLMHLCIAFALLSTAVAQNNDPSVSYGTVPYQTYLSDKEAINPGRGTLAVTIPILKLKGRNGHDFNSNLVYNSRIWWVQQINQTTYVWNHTNPWTNQFPVPLLIFDTNANPNGQTQYLCNTNYRVQMPDGRTIYFPGAANNCTLLNGTPAPQANWYKSTAADPGLKTTCSDFWYLSISPYATIKTESGQTFTFSPNGGTTIDEDSNGNQITYNGVAGTVTDTVGRTVTFAQTGTISYTDSNGSLQQVTAHWQSVHLTPTFNYINNQHGDTYVPLLSSLVFPNGDTYGFTYNGYGEMTKITYPTGGYTQYDYNTVSTDSGLPDVREIVAKHVCTSATGVCSTLDTTTFQPTFHATNPQGLITNTSNVILDPLGNQTIFTFDATYGFETQRQLYQGTANLTRTITTTSSCLGPSQVQVTLNDATGTAPVSMTQWDHKDTYTDVMYQQMGTVYNDNITAKREYDYGAVTPTRQTQTSWLHTNSVNGLDYTSPAIHILNRKTSETVQGSDSTPARQTTYEYDNYSNLQSSGAVQHDSTYSTGYMTRGNVTKGQRWSSTDNAWLSTTTSSYDDAGNALRSTDALNHSTQFGYADKWGNQSCIPSGGSAAAYLTTITNALSQVVTNYYNSCTGTVSSTQDPNSNTASFYYDAIGRLTETDYPPDSSGNVPQTKYCFSDDSDPSCSATGQIVVTETEKIWSGTIKVTQSYFDGVGRLQKTVLTTDPDCSPSTVDFTYDALNRKTSQSNPHCSGSSPTDGTTQYQYDPLSRITQITQPDLSTILTGYSGNLTTTTDEAGNKGKTQTDALGRVTFVWEDPDTLDFETDYLYNYQDALTSATQKGSGTPYRGRTYTYDSLARLTQAVTPESGTINYLYDYVGNITSKVMPQPNLTSGAGTETTNYTYDQLNRLTGKSYLQGTVSDPNTPAVAYWYDGSSPTGCTPTPANLTGNLIGYRTAMCDGFGVASWAYDSRGRVSTENRRTFGTSNNILSENFTYSYYLDGQISRIFYPSGVPGYALDFNSPNGAARITGVGDNQYNYVENATYSPNGALATALIGVSSTYSGNKILNTYSKRLQPTLLSASTWTNATIMSFTYDFHLGNGDNGNVFQIVNGRDNTRTQNFTYDKFNRITSAYTQGTTGAFCWGQLFGHMNGSTFVPGIDAWGNLNEITTSQCSAPPLSVSSTSHNQITGWCYDVAGNLLDQGACPQSGHTYTYDGENRLIKTAGYTYIYDGDGKRLKKCSTIPCTSGTLYWTGSGSDTLLESDLNANWTVAYAFLNGQRIARVDLPGDTVNYYFLDHLGSVRIVTNSNGTIEKESDFYPYGGEIVVSGSDANRFKFTGKERDSESGLDNFGARYNASTMGRFITPDPLGGKLVDPQTLNKYSYVRNNPASLIDPTGLYICKDSKDCSSDQDKKFENARKADLARGGDSARAAAAYGDPNKDNGVNVGFADLSKQNERGSTTSMIGADNEGNLRANSNVVIDSTASGDKLEAVVGHEGSHVADAQDLVKSITYDKLGNFTVGQDITQYQSEQRAFHVSDSILRSGNQTEKYNCGLSDCALGTGLKNPGQVTAEVDRILQNNYKSSINNQPLTPANQGGTVVPH